MQLYWPYQNHIPAGPNATYHDPSLLDRWAAACADVAVTYYSRRAEELIVILESESA